MAGKNPWMKFYPSDWRSDPRLRMCSLAARGLWIEMCGLMHEATPYGHLLVNGQPPTDAQLAVLVGAPPDQIPDLFRELDSAGVFSRTAQGVLYSRRMTRDEKKARHARKFGKSGGNPSLSKEKTISTQDKGQDKPPDKTQKPEARSQNLDNPSPLRAREDENPALKVIQAYDALRSEIFGAENARAWPGAKDLVIAERLLASGADLELCQWVFRARLEQRKAENGDPPGFLYFEKPILQEIENRKRPAPVVKPNGGGDPRQAETKAAVERLRAKVAAEEGADDPFYIPPELWRMA